MESNALPPEEIVCEKCGKPIDDCDCRCPYCGENEMCSCCFGREAATGG